MRSVAILLGGTLNCNHSGTRMTDGWSEGQFLYVDVMIEFVVRTHQERGYWTWVRQACQNILRA